MSKGRMARQKGARGEREVRDLVKEYGFEAKRGVQFGKGDHDNPDVKHNIPDTHIEVKRTETLSVYKAMEQARDDARESQKPIVFHKRNNKEWLVVMDARDYLEMEKGRINAPSYDDMEF